MKSFSLRLFLPLFLLLLAVVGCGTSKKSARSHGELPPRQPLTTAEQLLFNELFHESLISWERKEYDANKELLERALSIDSTAAEALWMLGRVQFVSATYDDSLQREEAIRNVRKAAYYCPNDVDIQQTLAIMLESVGYTEEALACYERVVEINPLKSRQLILAESYLRSEKYQEALGVYNRLERQGGLTDDVIQGKVVAYSELGDSLRLFSFLDTLICEHPNEYEYQVGKGAFYMQNYNRPDLALAIFNDVLKQSPTNERAQYALWDYYLKHSDYDRLFETTKMIVCNDHIEEPERAELLSNYFRVCGMLDSTRIYSVREFLDTLTYSENATGDISSLHTWLLHSFGASPDSIITAVQTTLMLQPENSGVRRLGVYYSMKTEDTEGLLQLSKDGRYYDPYTIEYYILGARFELWENGDTDEALAILESGTPYYMKSEDDTLASDIYIMMGDLYHMQDKLAECYAAYDSALALVPDNAGVLNNYAYFLSLENRDLDRAQTMAHKANELEPNNATYLDTYAWVLYQAGQYTQARIYIDRALEVMTEEEQSATYYQHAGDIYWKLGEKTKARKFWKQAEMLPAPENE